MSRETAMQRKGYRHNRRSRPQHQMDLFQSGLSNDGHRRARWPELPAEARAALTSLMTQLILDYAATTATPRARRLIMISDKVRPHHLERKAILYVRQSSAHQVLHNRESSALQYAMRDRLTALGWLEIEVIDDDLGRSAAGGVQRAGFERMVAEVCLGKVGAVCAREVSRFACNSRDWQQLIEMCRVVDTVLVDQETIYAPRHGNDRLLLGLKGSLNEYELDLLRQRSLSARYEKARRGELIVVRYFGDDYDERDKQREHYDNKDKEVVDYFSNYRKHVHVHGVILRSKYP